MSKEKFEKTEKIIEEEKEIEEKTVRDRLIELYFTGTGRDAQAVIETKNYIDSALRDKTLPKLLRLDIMEEIMRAPRLNNMWSRLPGGGERSWSNDILDAKRPQYSCTKRELFEMIDKELSEQGISKDEVENSWNQFGKIGKEKGYDSTEAKEIAGKLIEICHKIYPRLRAKSLTARDLAY